MGKSRNTKYNRDFSDYETVRKKDTRLQRKEKQNRRDRQYQIADDDGVNYEADDTYYTNRKW
jgi:hypothetical protein